MLHQHRTRPPRLSQLPQPQSPFEDRTPDSDSFYLEGDITRFLNESSKVWRSWLLHD